MLSLPVVVLLGDVDESCVCVGADGEEGGFSCQHSQCPNQVARVSQEEGSLKQNTNGDEVMIKCNQTLTNVYGLIHHKVKRNP